MALQDHGAVRVHILPVLSDNYSYLVEWVTGCAVVDPGASGPVRDLLTRLALPLQHILLTHLHQDHQAGVADLVATWACPVLAPASAKANRAFHAVHAGDVLPIGPVSFDVIGTPGHTTADLSYYSASAGMLFCGDTLFAGGCGRLLECPPEVMWDSLQKLSTLPGDTRVYCGHEYTLDNLAFARAQWPDHAGILARAARVAAERQAGRPTIPSTIAEERATNIFLLAVRPELQRHLGMAGRPDAAVYAELRRRKDNFA